MPSSTPKNAPQAKSSGRPIPSITRLIQSKGFERQAYEAYRDEVRSWYDGIPGKFLAAASFMSGHTALARKLFAPGNFDIQGARRILDAGCGAGQFIRQILEIARPDAVIVGSDLSSQMLRRGRQRLKSPRPHWLASDLTRLPYADASFDRVICGWVIEHLPTAELGLHEVARVLEPGGRLLMLVTENTLFGAGNSRLWKCRTYDRHELQEASRRVGLRWIREYWLSPLHRQLRMGGIVVEAEREEDRGSWIENSQKDFA